MVMSALQILDEDDLPWIANAVDVLEHCTGQPWRIAMDGIERIPVTAHRLAAVVGAMHRVLGGRARRAQLARRTRGLVLGPAAVDIGIRNARIGSAARTLGVTDCEVEVLLWSDLPRERPVELPEGRPSELELAAFANVQLIQRALRRAQSVVIRIWGDAGTMIRAARARGLLVTLAGGAEGETVLEIVGPLALFHRTTVYGRALGGLVPLLAGCERFELELTGETATTSYTSRLCSPALLPAAPTESWESAVRERLSRDLLRRARCTIEVPAPIANGRDFVCPDLVVELSGIRWWIEIVGFWTAAYLEHKLARYREAGITNVVFCVDESRACADDATPPGARTVGYRRHVDADLVLEIIAAK
jgi:predicted nuclease of restriction endonuclease-like RecB superfamily